MVAVGFFLPRRLQNGIPIWPLEQIDERFSLVFIELGGFLFIPIGLESKSLFAKIKSFFYYFDQRRLTFIGPY